MINLLSSNDKHQLQAARRNVMLLRYNIIILITLLVIGGVYGGGFFITMRGKMIAETQLNEDQARTASYTTVRTTIEQFSKNLTTAKTILSNEVVYSTLITDVAKSLPPGAVLSELTLGPDSFGKEITLGAATTNYGKSLELKSSLEKSALFSDVSLESVARTGTDQAGSTQYPIAVVIKATFATEAEIKALREKPS